jgi:hypothetical protein
MDLLRPLPAATLICIREFRAALTAIFLFKRRAGNRHAPRLWRRAEGTFPYSWARLGGSFVAASFIVQKRKFQLDNDFATVYA